MVVSGRVRLRLTDDHRQQRRGALDLALVPTGAIVVLEVGDRWPLLDQWVLGELRAHASRLTLEIEGRPDAVRSGVAAVRGEDQ